MPTSGPYEPVLDMCKLQELILYIGRRPLRAGRVGLAVVLHLSDMEAYGRHGRSITGSRYLKACVPGERRGRVGVLRGAVDGWRWGRIEHDLRAGCLTRRDAAWIAEQWRGGVPV